MQYNFGKKALLDAINNKEIISEVYILNKNQEIINLANKNKININFVDSNWFMQFEKQLNHQFIAFIVLSKKIKKISIEEFLKEEREKSLVLILDEIEDPRNFGAIIRTANAFGVDAIIYKKNNQAPINELVIKTSMGAVNYTNLIEIANISNAIKLLQKKDYWVYASALENGVDYTKINYPNKSVLIVGNENKGISQLVLKNSDQKIYIPMYGEVQSLNVGVATGIMLAQMAKRN